MAAMAHRRACAALQMDAVAVSSCTSCAMTQHCALKQKISQGFDVPEVSRRMRMRSRRSFDVVRAMDAKKEGNAPAGRFYFNVTGFPFPLGPFFQRRTIRKELLNELEAPVKYIILPTFAYEHKIFVGPFSRKYPRAEVWVAPRQWSWPINLPLPLLGIFKAKIIRDDSTSAPWADEIDQKVLSCPVGVGPFVEVAFFHKKSKTLLVTDAVIYVPEKPPEVVGKEALLDAAKNGLAVKILSAGKEVPNDPIVDDSATRQRGWERMVLQILFLGPSDLLEPKQSFAAMSEKLIVSPIVKTLVFCKEPERVKDWVTRITRDWKFKSIIPAHFAAPIAADGRDLKLAFKFLNDLLPDEEEKEPSFVVSIATLFSKASSVFPSADMKTLSSLDEFLVSVGAVRKTVSGKMRR